MCAASLCKQRMSTMLAAYSTAGSHIYKITNTPSFAILRSTSFCVAISHQEAVCCSIRRVDCCMLARKATNPIVPMFLPFFCS